MKPLFRTGDFTFHSGDVSNWKIDCDALSLDDLDTLARYAARHLLPPYSDVIGVPEGGLRFANQLNQYSSPDVDVVLIADDVLTTGASMQEWWDKFKAGDVIGVVIFARSECQSWVTPIFQLTSPMESTR